MNDGRSSRRSGLGRLLAVIGAATLVGLALAFFGFLDVSADGDHLPGVEWFLHEAGEHAVERAAERAELAPPADLAAPARRERGRVHYREMCLTCHGAPGVAPSEIGRGLNPTPPELAEKRVEPEEAFWVAKHGLRMTGMPAFGETHDDEALWDIVAFLGELPDLTPEAWAARAKEPAPGVPEHTHGEDSPPHSHGDPDGN